MDLDDVQGLVYGGLGIEGQLGVDLSRDLAGNDLEDLPAELDEEAIYSGIGLLVNSLTLLFAIGDSGINEGGIIGLLGSS